MASSRDTRAGSQARVMLWSVPRSTSTIFLKCLSFIPDADIFFEPFYFPFEAECNLKGSGITVDHDQTLGDDVWRRAAVMICEEDCSGDRVQLDMLRYPVVKRMLDSPNPLKKVVLMKDVSQSVDPDHYQFLPDASSNYRYSFLLRHPAKVFSSWRRIIYSILKEVGDGSGNKLTKPLESFHIVHDAPEKYNITDLCFKYLFDMWMYVKDAGLDTNPVVVDSDDLLSDPAGIVSKYCAMVGIPFSDSLLTWDAHPRTTDAWKSAFMPPRDFEFIRMFCLNAFKTSSFLPPGPVPSMTDLTDDVKEAVEKSMPYYDAMYKARIMP